MSASNIEEYQEYKEERGFSLPYLPNYELIETEEKAKEAVEELMKERVVSVDTETTGLDPFNDRLLLLQVATPNKCFILNCTVVRPSLFNAVLSNQSILKIVQNAKFDYKFLKVHAGISMRPLFDTMLAEILLTAGKQSAASLQFMASKYLGLEISKDIRKDFVKTIRTKFTKAELLYAANDALMLHEIYNRQIDMLQRDEMVAVALLEFKTVVPLAEMELNGCLLDRNKWMAFLEISKKNRDTVEEKIQELIKPICNQLSIFGESTINISSQKQLLESLHKLGINVPDTSESWLKKIKHPIGPLLMEWRAWEKIISAYGSKFLAKINTATGRLHAEFNQIRAETGRMSSSRPNLQQIPGYNPDSDNDARSMVNFRSCFISSPGYKMLDADFSQQELRILACVSMDRNMIKAYLHDEDIHTKTALGIWGGTDEELRRSGKRKVAKIVNFLVSYGGSSVALAEQADLTEEEAADIIDGYFRTYPGVKTFLNNAGNFAVENGYSLTISGRRRYYDVPALDDPDYKKKISAIRRRGANSIIQGSASDVSKQALCSFFYECENKGLDVRVLMIIHDEIVCEVKEDQAEEVAKLLEKSMIKGFSDFFKAIPMKADCVIDTCWKH